MATPKSVADKWTMPFIIQCIQWVSAYISTYIICVYTYLIWIDNMDMRSWYWYYMTIAHKVIFNMRISRFTDDHVKATLHLFGAFWKTLLKMVDQHGPAMKAARLGKQNDWPSQNGPVMASFYQHQVLGHNFHVENTLHAYLVPLDLFNRGHCEAPPRPASASSYLGPPVEYPIKPPPHRTGSSMGYEWSLDDKGTLPGNHW